MNTAAATEKQISFIASLVAERDLTALASQVEAARDDVAARTFSRADASALITALLEAPRAAAPVQTAELEEGMYVRDGSIFKVQRAVHGSGNLYAKVLVRETHEGRCAGHLPDNDPSAFDAPWSYCSDEATCSRWVDGETTVTFEYAAGAVGRLTPNHKMGLEQAKEFGALYGTCVVCGRTLTNEDSIAAGIGPVCAERF